MSRFIADAMNTLNIQITPKMIKDIEDVVISFEIKYPIALNSQTIAVSPIVFTDKDREVLFEVFGVDQKIVRGLVQRCSSINPEFKVVSDPFNVLSVWLLHLGFRDIKDLKQRETFLLSISKYLHYRFFTSLVNGYFIHRADEKFMNAAINDLSRKYDIVTYGTWKVMIEARCLDLISSNSIHHKTLISADDDKDFLYVITDCQSRIRDKIKNITKAYYDAREEGTAIGSRSATKDTEDGKILIHNTRTLDLMIYNLLNEITIPRLFVDSDTIRSVASQFSSVTSDMLRSMLLSVVDIASTQKDSGQLDLIKKNDGIDIYIGMRVFITNFILILYRHCMHNGVDITNKAAVYTKIKNVVGSSRVTDKDIISIKQSVVYLVDLIGISRRDTTKSSLSIALIMYILIRSFRFL